MAKTYEAISTEITEKIVPKVRAVDHQMIEQDILDFAKEISDRVDLLETPFLYKGTFTIGDPLYNDYTYNVPIPTISIPYKILGSLTGASSNQNIGSSFIICAKNTNSFDLGIFAENGVQGLVFDFVIIKA